MKYSAPVRSLPCLLPFLAVMAMTSSVGCTREDEGETAEKPPIPFEGKPDAKFVGFWKQTNRDASYDIKPDGTFDYKGKVSTPGGVIDTSFSSTWLVNGDRMLLKDQSGNVTQYKHKLEGNKLTLSSTGSMKIEVSYIRK